jgi:response regulator of citrate/malate metabolism
VDKLLVIHRLSTVEQGMDQEKVDQARALRDKGLLFREIAEQMGVSKTTARCYAAGTTNSRKIQGVCNESRSGYDERCNRYAGHGGVHLANNENGLLIYWI